MFPKVIESAALHADDILIVSGKDAYLYHNGVWVAIPDYAERVTAFIDALPLAKLPTLA